MANTTDIFIEFTKRIKGHRNEIFLHMLNEEHFIHLTEMPEDTGDIFADFKLPHFLKKLDITF